MPRPDVEAAFARYQRTGAPEALGEVFDAAAGELFRVASHLTRDLHAAEDLVQATFLVAIERRGDYAPAGQGVLAWLLGILANRARRLHATPPVDARQLAERLAQRRGAGAAPTDPARAVEQRELDDAVGDALERLPETYRIVLRMHLRLGLPAGEIALLLERPPGTVRTQLVRGMDLLRRALPGGLAVGAAALATPLRGLAAVREAVVARALELAPAAAAAVAAGTAGAGAAAAGAAAIGSWALFGGLLMQKVLFGVAAVALLVLGWIAWPAPDAAPIDAAAAGVRDTVAATPTDAPPEAAAAPRDGAAVRAAVATESAPEPGTIGRGPARLVGRVVAASTGAPLRAQVTLRRVPATEAVERTAASEFREPEQRTTDGDGVFAFPVDADPRWQVGLQFAAEGHAAMRVGVGEFEPGDRDLGTIALPALVDVAGRVVDTDGRAAAGVRLQFELPRDTAALGSPVAGSFRTNSDVDGRFVLDGGVPAIRWQVFAQLHGLSCAVGPVDLSREGALPLEIVVPARRELQFVQGVVQDGAGAPVPHALVHVAYEGVRAQATDANGRFVFARRRASTPDEVVIAVEGQGIERWQGKVGWGDERAVVVVQRTAAHSLLLEVVHVETGEPVEAFGAMVFGDPLRGVGSGNRRPGDAGPHAGGRLLREHLRPGVHIVRVLPEDEALAASPFTEVEVDGPSRLRVAVHAARTREVQVVRRDGSPVAGSRVTWLAAIRDVPLRRDTRIVEDLGWLASSRNPGPEAIARASELFHLGAWTTDARGTIQLRGGPQPRSALLVEGEHLDAFVLPVDVTQASPWRIVVESGGRIRGRVEPATVAHAVSPGLWLISADDSLVQLPVQTRSELREAVPVAADGTFVFPNVPPGRWQLCLAVVHSGTTRLERLIDLPPVQDGAVCDAGTVDVSRFAPGELRARILVDGAPAGEAAVTVNPDWEAVRRSPPLNQGGRPGWIGNSHLEVRSDANGTFALTLLPGDYGIYVRASGSAGVPRTLRVPGPVRVAAGDRQDVVFALRHIRLRVRLVDGAGRPVANRSCEVPAPYRDHQTTDADGWLTFDPAPLEPFSVRIWPQSAPGNGAAAPAAPVAQATEPQPIELGPIAVPLTNEAEVTLRLVETR